MSKLSDDFSLSPLPEEAGQSGSVFLFISLYSLLLAFFIMLYTYATVTKYKADVVSGSVKESFNKGTASKHAEPEKIDFSPFGSEALLHSSFGELRRVAKELLAVDDAAIIERGDRLVLRLPVAMLFVEGQPLVDDRKNFLKAMADNVTTAPLGLQLDIEFKMPRLPVAKEADSLMVRRSGAFARLLVEMGIPEDAIYVGMSEGGAADMLEITFSPRNISKSSLEFRAP